MYRDSDVSPMEALKGALRVFRTPRTRNILRHESMQLSELCQRVLMQLMLPSGASKDELSADPLECWQLDECLDVLRGLAVEEEPPLENSSLAGTAAASQLKIVSDWSARTDENAASHDKALLVHVCALHAQLCRVTGLIARSRVFLFDVIRLNANIKGLHLATTMIEISPELLTTELDHKFRERQMILKDAVLHALVVVAGVASEKQQKLFDETGVELMHRISRAIQRDELDMVDGASVDFQREFVLRLSNQVFAAPEAVMGSAEASFQVGKSLQLLVASHGESALALGFPLTRFRELFRDHEAASSRAGREWTTRVAGFLVSTMASGKGEEAAKYVEEGVEWFTELLSTGCTEESQRWQLPCATACVDIALNASSLEVSARRRSVFAVLRWFDCQASERLLQLPPVFVRRLRSAVLTTRPPTALRQTNSAR